MSVTRELSLEDIMVLRSALFRGRHSVRLCRCINLHCLCLILFVNMSTPEGGSGVIDDCFFPLELRVEETLTTAGLDF